MAGIPFAPYSVNDEAAHGPCVSSLVPITVDGIGFLLLPTLEPCTNSRTLASKPWFEFVSSFEPSTCFACELV